MMKMKPQPERVDPQLMKTIRDGYDFREEAMEAVLGELDYWRAKAAGRHCELLTSVLDGLKMSVDACAELAVADEEQRPLIRIQKASPGFMDDIYGRFVLATVTPELRVVVLLDSGEHLELAPVETPPWANAEKHWVRNRRGNGLAFARRDVPEDFIYFIHATPPERSV